MRERPRHFQGYPWPYFDPTTGLFHASTTDDKAACGLSVEDLPDLYEVSGETVIRVCEKCRRFGERFYSRTNVFAREAEADEEPEE